MSDTFVPVNPGGASNAAPVETWQISSGYHRQVMVIGGTNSTFAPVDNTTGLSVNVEELPGATADDGENASLKLPVLPAKANSSAPSWTDGRQVPLSVDLSGALRTSPGFPNISVSRLSQIQTATAGQTTFTFNTAYTPGNNSLELFVNGVKVRVGADYDYIEVTSTSVQFNYGLSAGTQVEAVISGAGVSGPFLQVTNSGTSWTNVGYSPGAIAAPVQVQNGLTINSWPQTTAYRNLNVNATGVSVKGSAGKVLGWAMYNAAGSTRFVKVYDKATAPTVGTDTPILTIPITTGQTNNQVGSLNIPFTLGIGLGATTGVADNDTGNPASNEVIVNLFYS